jgi:endonuclease G
MNKLEYIAKGEQNLVKEISAIIDSGKNLPLAVKRGIKPEAVKSIIENFKRADELPQVEAVVLPFMRPVLFVRNGEIEIPESNELKERLLKYKPVIEQPLKSVGRIELKNHQLRAIGTGWLLADDIIITNRHVAEYFAFKQKTDQAGGAFRRNFLGAAIQVVIDFKEEYQPSLSANDSKNQYEVTIDKIVYLPDESRILPDLALLKINNASHLPAPVPFVADKLEADQLIGVVGYPLQDPRGVTDSQMERRIFGDVFGVKRYAPGQVISVPKQDWYFLHDASTLGGNSSVMEIHLSSRGAT